MEDPKSLPHMFTTEVLATFFLVFAGCGTVTTNLYNENVVTLGGITSAWGLTITIFVLILGAIYGAHFSYLITALHAIIKTPPSMQVPIHIVAQYVGSILATDILKLIFSSNGNYIVGLVPNGSNLQFFVIEFITSFYTLFIIFGVFIDRRKIGELVGQTIRATFILSALFAGPITRALMNPPGNIRPTFISEECIHLVSPIIGAMSGSWAYTFFKFNKKSIRELISELYGFKGVMMMALIVTALLVGLVKLELL